MLSDNLRFFRVKEGLSQQQLADKIGVSKMLISYYESGKRMVNSSTLLKLCDVFGILPAQLLLDQEAGVSVSFRSFRKGRISSKKEESIKGEVDRYLQKLFLVERLLGGHVLPDAPIIEKKEHVCVKQSALYVRTYLKAAEKGPLGSLVDILENNGFIVVILPFEDTSFSGLNGIVNNRPFVVVNKNISNERKRFTLAHELVHILVSVSDENTVDAIAGELLLPSADIIRELGPKRMNIVSDLSLLQKEYSVSYSMIAYRAKQEGIITEHSFVSLMKWISANKQKNSQIIEEDSHLFGQLVVRGVLEGSISKSKAAELFGCPEYEVRRKLVSEGYVCL